MTLNKVGIKEHWYGQLSYQIRKVPHAGKSGKIFQTDEHAIDGTAQGDTWGVDPDPEMEGFEVFGSMTSSDDGDTAF